MGQAQCAAFLVTNEVVCRNLTPGAYALSQVRGGTTIATQTVTVPTQPSTPATSNFVPSLGSASFAGLQGGDQLTLASGAHVLTTLTVRPFTVASVSPLGDPLNGSNTTVTGTCSPSEYFNNGNDVLCSPAGSIPSPNGLNSNLSLFVDPPVNETLGQLDDTSNGYTQIDMPRVSFQTPSDSPQAIQTPFNVIAFAAYDDPAALAARFDTVLPSPTPVFPSTPSALPVLFQYAPLGSSNFTTLGNVNVAGGLPLPTLTPGVYEFRFIMTDARGDSYFADDSTFTYQGNATGPAGVSPTGPPAPSCKASGISGQAKAKAKKKKKKSVMATAAAKKKKKAKKKTPAVTINCTSKTAGALVAVWLQRGTNVVANGSGVVKKGKVKIVLSSSAIKKGTYQLIDTIESGGQSTEATNTLTLK